MAEMLDRDVSCKFCNESFRAWSSLANVGLAACPGEHKALNRPAPWLKVPADFPDARHDLEFGGAELNRMAEQRIARVER
ncbi:MAG: hypothetical protein ACP5XB_27830, partial [Isosphaeraceae bacterium]